MENEQVDILSAARYSYISSNMYSFGGDIVKRRALCLILSIVLCCSLLPLQSMAARDVSYEESLAVQLKTLGLFKGISETDFDLERPPTREEALVILIRLLGKEQDALANHWRHPFSDVASWSDHYVGYAYQNGLTNGVSDTKFGTGNADAAMFVTFVLRALGYSDADGMDFTWNNPYTLASAVGILPQGVDAVHFWRADVVAVSYHSLSAKMKDSAQTLAEKLISDGVFTQAQYESIQPGKPDPSQSQGNENTASNSSTVSPQPVLSSKEIYAKCSPAVFCIQTYDTYRHPYALGSGFFIDQSGIAVTNYHVMENAVSATATLTDGTVRSISGLIYYNIKYDYAVIKVDGSGYASLPVGDSASVVGGQTIYTIGNPQGLTNTIADGIISNPYRQDYNGMIQITAPISHGSSGGALIDEYGRVLGITTASLTDGQNLNFAVPISYVVDKGEIIANMLTKYGMITMSEFAGKSGTLGTDKKAGGNEEGGKRKNVGDRKKEAVDILKSYISSNSNATYASLPSVKREYRLDATFSCSIFVAGIDEIFISCEQQENEDFYSVMFSVDNNSNTVVLSFTYSNFNLQTITSKKLVSANCILDSETSYVDMPISFDHYEGANNLRIRSEDAASLLYSLGMIYLSDMLSAACPSREYSMADLGFSQI